MYCDFSFARKSSSLPSLFPIVASWVWNFCRILSNYQLLRLEASGSDPGGWRPLYKSTVWNIILFSCWHWSCEVIAINTLLRYPDYACIFDKARHAMQRWFVLVCGRLLTTQNQKFTIMVLNSLQDMHHQYCCCLVWYSLSFSLVHTQTFFDLRNRLTNANVDVQSFELHHSELENEKEEIFSFVSQKQFRPVPVIFLFIAE